MLGNDLSYVIIMFFVLLLNVKMVVPFKPCTSPLRLPGISDNQLKVTVMNIEFKDEEACMKEFAFSELEKALKLYEEQKQRLKTEFSIDLGWDKDIIRKLESRLSLLNTKITTIALALTQKDHPVLAGI